MADDTGRCINCGFLCKIRRQVDAEVIVYQATSNNRETGTFSRYSGWPNGRDIPTQITCFRNTVNLQKELTDVLAMAGQTGRDAENEHTLAIIEKPRKCESWYLWTEHLSPKEHLEMLDRERWQEWQEKQRRNDKRWRIIELIVLILAAGLFTLLGAFIERGCIP